MAINSETTTEKGKAAHSKSAEIARQGIRTTKNIADFSSALITDIMTGAVDIPTAHAAMKATDQMVRSVEFQLKYQDRRRELIDSAPLQLAGGSDATPAATRTETVEVTEEAETNAGSIPNGPGRRRCLECGVPKPEHKFQKREVDGHVEYGACLQCAATD